MTQLAFVEILITREERWPALAQQQGDDLVVLHPAPSDVVANLPDSDMPMFEKLSLIGGNIFVEDVHAGTGSSPNSSA